MQSYPHCQQQPHPVRLPAGRPLIHADDVARIGADNCTITPTGAAFLQPSIRPGVLPAILSALMSARATTRAALKGVQQQLQQARQAQQQQQREAGSGAVGDAAAGSSKHAGEGVAQLVARAAVLDGRQKALKVTANALYVSTEPTQLYLPGLCFVAYMFCCPHCLCRSLGNVALA